MPDPQIAKQLIKLRREKLNLEKRYRKALSDYNSLQQQIKVIENRLSEINKLIKKLT